MNVQKSNLPPKVPGYETMRELRKAIYGLILMLFSVLTVACGDTSASLPQKPTSIVATARSSRVDITWEMTPGATSYKIYSATSPDDTFVVRSSLTPQYQLTGLTNETPYYIKISAVNSKGESEPSATLKVTPSPVLENPYEPKNIALKGQLHCHTTNSDGNSTPLVVGQAYKDAGYDFIMFSDHDKFTPPPALPDFIFLQGVEETTHEGHILSVNVQKNVQTWDTQLVLNQIKDDGGMAIIAHPNHPSLGFDLNQLIGLKNFTGIEIFNSLSSIIKANPNAENKWDILLAAGNKVYGFATDDMHILDPAKGFNGGWIKVFTDSASASEVIEGIKNGNFFASTGPNLAISQNGTELTAVTDPSSTIEFITGNGIAKTEANVARSSYKVQGHEKYVRVRVTASNGKRAWSNPVFVN